MFPFQHKICLCKASFFYKEIIYEDIGWIDDIKRPTKSKHIPVVFTKSEAHSIISNMEGLPKLMQSLLYGLGLRLSEVFRLRVKDIDFEYNQIIVRDGKGEKDWTTLLPQSLIPYIKEQIEERRLLHNYDLIIKNLGLGSKKLATGVPLCRTKTKNSFSA